VVGWKLWMAIILLVLSGGTASAQTLRVIPVPPHIRPQWTQVPDNPKVLHAPNVPADVFKGPGGAGYFFYLDRYWYRSKTLNGPWTMLQEVPEYLYRIGPQYFKGKGGAPAPPPVKPPGVSPPTVAGDAGSQAGRAAPGGPTPGPTVQPPTPTLPSVAAVPGAQATPSALAPPPEPVFMNDPGPP